VRIRDAWCKETSYYPDKWSRLNPAVGQCVVTALVLQDIMGGSIIKCYVGEDRLSHYYLRTEGIDLDLTFEQWLDDDTYRPFIEEIVGPVSREKLLANDDTRRRYILLSERVIGRPV